MNEIVKSIYERKSVRAFENKPVSEEIKSLLIDSALQAPTAGNQILYSIIDVTNQALKQKLSLTCDNQPFIAKAPLVFIFVADHTRWVRSFTIANAIPRKLGVGDFMLAVTDTAIAAQNMVVAAESFGLGSCYIGDILENYEEHSEMLNLPKYTLPVCMLVLGYPTTQQKERKKPERIDKKYVVGQNSYPHLTDEELISCYETRTNGKPFDEYMQAFCKRKFNSDFSKEMTRSVKAFLDSLEQ